MKGRVHKALKLAHHRHTARPLAHHHTSYRALFVVVGIAGLSMATIQYAAADDYLVNATVPGSIITIPAVISSPADGTVVNNPNITVSGTCEVVNSGTFVIIKKGTTALGTGVCQSDSTFSINLTLALGDNILTPTEVDGNSNPGPDGTPVTVNYTIPPPPPVIPPAPTGGITATPPTSTPPNPALSIQSEVPPLVERSVDRGVTIVFSVLSGSTPYVIVADWGDGKIDTVHASKAGESIRLTHIYDTPGAYTIVLNATDSKGNKATYQYVALAQASALALATPSATVIPPTLSYTNVFGSWATLTRVVWASYGLLSFAVIGMWLVSPTHTLLARPVTEVIRSRTVHRSKKVG